MSRRAHGPTYRRVDGRKLREIREDRGLTLKQVATLLGTKSHGYLSRMENDDPTCRPTAVYVGRIAKVLRAPLDSFTTREPFPVAPVAEAPADGVAA